MGVSPSDFQEHFSSLSDTALMEIHRDDLIEAAKAVYDQEMTRRGLVPEDTGEPESPELSSGEKLVNVVEFESAEDAAHAQEQLKKNGIPAYIAVAVPEAFARQAVSLLDPGVSDEELAALAESAAAKTQN
jgi:hypothetical protein